MQCLKFIFTFSNVPSNILINSRLFSFFIKFSAFRKSFLYNLPIIFPWRKFFMCLKPRNFYPHRFWPKIFNPSRFLRSTLFPRKYINTIFLIRNKIVPCKITLSQSLRNDKSFSLISFGFSRLLLSSIVKVGKRKLWSENFVIYYNTYHFFSNQFR